jgi:tetratricopeptide (TPR) repeat protein
MAMPRPNLVTSAAVAVTLAVALLVFSALNRGDEVAVPSPPPAQASTSADDRIRALQGAVERRPRDGDAYAALADAYLQKVRDGGDPSFYARAEEALATGRIREPRNPAVATGLGTLALARHEFREALRLGREARALAPATVRPLGVIADAQVELGRYDAAARTLQRMVDLKPNLASYSRVSYFRELHGDLDGAVAAMRLAVSSGGDARENVAYVETLLGNLELERGRPGAARAAYDAALARFVGHAPATAGLARLEAVAGRLDLAIIRYRELVQRLPLPEYVIALGEAQLAAGRTREARAAFELVRAEQALLEENGVNTDVELAVFEADHGDRRRAVVLARRGYRAAPGVRSADALGWALTRAGRPDEGLRYGRRSLRLGWRDAPALYHAGMSARGAGRPLEAQRLLRRALGAGYLAPLHRAHARRALRRLR